MAEKKQESFTVTDRRLFTTDGEKRKETTEEEVSTQTPEPAPAPQKTASQPEAQNVAGTSTEPQMPPMPTAAEQQEQADAYHKSAKDLDSRVELSGHSAKELEMTFA